MENITVLKDGKKIFKQLLGYVSEISFNQVVSFIICFIFSRANFFGVIKPFATALYVSARFTRMSKVAAIITITLGNALFSNYFETARQTLALLFFEAFSHLIFRLGNKNETDYSRAVLMSVVVFFTGIIRGMAQGIHLYDFVVSVLCAALVFSLAAILAPAMESFRNTQNKASAPEKVSFSKSVLLSCLIISLKGIKILNLETGFILAGIAVILIARHKGSARGALAGALIGIVIAFYDIPSSLQIPGMLALAGAASGISDKSKTLNATMWLIVTIFFSGLSSLSNNLTVIYYESLAAGVLFLVMPSPIINYLGNKLTGIKYNPRPQGSNEYGQIHEAADKLLLLSRALSRVSRNIEETVLEEEEAKSGTEWIAEMTAERVCSQCSFSVRCWKMNFVKTYKLVENAISGLKTDEYGQFEVPAWFKKSCPKYNKFFENLGTAYSLYKTENIWKEKISESRMLLARQAALISGNILAAARSMLDMSVRDREIEDAVLGMAASSKIPVTTVRYNKKQDTRPYLDVVLESRHKVNPSEIDEIVESILSSRFVRAGENRRDMMGYSVIRYMKQPRYKTVTGIARVSRTGKEISGDTYTFFISREGYHISAISDGAGSGSLAEKYSRTAIQMLENLVSDGIELGQAIRLLNLYLDLRGENERLATMDICAIDLYTGDVSFYKYDAAPSFVTGQEGVSVFSHGKRMDEENTPHYSCTSMKKGDMVIMVSDGIIEAFSEDGEITPLQRFIQNTDTVNAQHLADLILQEAVARSEGNHDDMTVLTTRLW